MCFVEKVYSSLFSCTHQALGRKILICWENAIKSLQFIIYYLFQRVEKKCDFNFAENWTCFAICFKLCLRSLLRRDRSETTINSGNYKHTWIQALTVLVLRRSYLTTSTLVTVATNSGCCWPVVYQTEGSATNVLRDMSSHLIWLFVYHSRNIK